MIRFATRRPVAVSMLIAALLLFGFVSLSRLSVTLLPDLNYPTLTIRTELPGAAPTEIETLLSKPVEEALGVIKGVRRVRSVSRPGQSDVTLEFNWGTAMDYAVLDVREKLDTLSLPEEAVRPVVLRFDPSEDPIIRLGLTFKAEGAPRETEAALKQLRRVAEDLIQKPLEAVDGVAAVKISGGLEEEVQVSVDLRKLAALNLSLQEVASRLQAENANISGGRVDQGSASYLVRTLNQFTSLAEIGETILDTRPNPADPSQPPTAIYLRDIAEVRDGYREREAIIRIDGQEAVEIALYKEGDGNTVTIAREAFRGIERLQPFLPPEVTLRTLYDQSIFIQQAIDSVAESALYGGVLAVLVLYLFLRSAWATAVVSVTIPVTVIAGFNFMYGAGISLNIMSLGGIALAVGMLVDNAIVILENIARKREQGLEGLAAAEAGAGEMVGAVVASTLTSVAVFFPMVFVQGIAGQLFSDQALVVSAAQIISLGVGLTLIPMLAARQARQRAVWPASPLHETGPAWRRGLSRTRWVLLESLATWILRPLLWLLGGLAWLLGRLMGPLAAGWSAAFARLEVRYEQALGWALGHRGLVLGIALSLFGLALLGLQQLRLELIPPFNQGEFMAEITAAPGTPLERTDALLTRLSVPFTGDPRLKANYTVAGTGNRLDANAEAGGENYGTLNLVLAGGASEAELMRELSARLDTEPGVGYRYTRPTLFTLKTPLEVELAGYDLAALSRYAESLRLKMVESGRFREIETTQEPGHPEIQIVFDQERAAALGLDTAELAQRVVRAVQGDIATRYRLADRDIDVRVRVREADRQDVEAIRALVINPEAERPLTLDAVASVQLASGPSEIQRVDQSRVVVISAGLASGDLGEATRELEAMIAELQLPPGLGARVSGQSEEMKVSFRSLQFALLLAVFLVYVVMASQFESLRQPFVILFTIPLAVIGAVFGLLAADMALNVVALIGLIVLAGIVVNNGIVLIDMINRLRQEEGYARQQAVIEAGRSRLRAIMMTMLTSVLGVLPIALAGGEGSEVSAPMAVVIAGGLSVATLLTLFVIPVVYTLIDRETEGGRHER
ncbi:MAG TPA: efflux RND transporter permease subunit [Nevskiaceae bacterium]|nr:efflux RND transporter permease subunit [Nevskiaceae bacterium]